MDLRAMRDYGSSPVLAHTLRSHPMDPRPWGSEGTAGFISVRFPYSGLTNLRKYLILLWDGWDSNPGPKP
jgi:hypothetical protein